MKEKKYPESDAELTWNEGAAIYSIVYHDTCKHYCGYCRLPKRYNVEAGYGGILTWVPVHGGITYSKEHEDGSMVYGFDCGHSGDSTDSNVTNIDWLKYQCRLMAYSILRSTLFEERYLLANTEEEKATILDEFRKTLISICDTDQRGLGQLSGILLGKF